jgi:2-oxoglutarate ferredoxin oxidoreductase subunit beta
MKTSKQKGVRTNEHITWCPGCPDHMVLKSVRLMIQKQMKENKTKQTDYAIVCDIGCNGKMFDYLNLPGVYTLHGRAVPVAIGVTIGNPNTKVMAFAGDGAEYAEGIAHFVHSFRYNSNMTLILHDNQSFSLTTGQPSPTSQHGYKAKSKPYGEENYPLNPIMIALASGATFIARINARDIMNNIEVLEKAMNHNGFAFVEVIQDCMIFNIEANNKDHRMYVVKDNKDNYKKALMYAQEFNYDSKEGKIPMGILYQNTKAQSLQDKWPQLARLKKKKKSFGDLRS